VQLRQRTIEKVFGHRLLHTSNPMPKNEKEIVRIELTPSQKETIKTATDKSAEAIELTVQELEARITPKIVF